MTEPVLPYNDSNASKKEQVTTMFNSISQNYDFLNHFLSFGYDRMWRRKAIRKLRHSHPQVILDVATGTGDLAIEAVKLQPLKVIGVDISEEMLKIAYQKIKQRNLLEKIDLYKADSEKLPFQDNTFDAVTVGFGVRKFENLQQGLQVILRVLKPGGKTVILEFSKPKKFPFNQLNRLYTRKILPLV